MEPTVRKGPLAWFVHNHVAANLLMVFVLAAGVMSLVGIKQEVFPEINLETISIVVPYPGASPEEVEEGICTRIEEQVASVDGVKSIRSSAREGAGTVLLELERGTDLRKALDDVKSEVDRITTFPDEAEAPVVVELTNRRQVLNLVVYGDVPERTLKVLADRVRTDLTSLPNISQVDVSGTREYQISIEVPEESLRRYGLSLGQIAGIVRSSSLDLPAGNLKTAGGDILVRTKGQRYTGREFEEIVLLTRPDGTRLRLGDVARVVDGFDEDAVQVTRYDGVPAVLLQVFRVGQQDALDVAGAVKGYIEERQGALPAGIRLGVWHDRTRVLEGRRDLLIRNGKLGLALVFLSLLLFLDLRLAFWVTMGIPISFLGAFALLPWFGTSVNMISLFAFILSLGIVVDDAIVVGEGVYAHYEGGESAFTSAVRGAREMSVPVTFSVLTTVAAFMPLLFVEGTMGKFMGTIPTVVIAVLSISLLESLFILPAHLSGMRGKHHSQDAGSRKPWPLERLRRMFGRGLMALVRGPYAWFLARAVNWRYLTVAAFLAVLLVSLGWVGAGRVKFVFLPKVESDTVKANLAMPQGSALDQTTAVVQRIEAAARELQEELTEDGQPVIEHIYALVGGQTAAGGPMGAASRGTHLGTVTLQLLPGEERSTPSAQVASLWRERVGSVAGAESLLFSSSLFSSGEPISVRLSGERFETLREAAARVRNELANYPGIKDIRDSFRQGKIEMRLKLKPAARTLGLTLSDLARQVRGGYYGDEAVRVQRGRDELKVMVRYPAEERRSLGDVEKIRVRTASGAEVPFAQVAEVELVRGYASVEREERRRVVSVIADVDEAVTNAGEVLGDLQSRFLPGLLNDYPGLAYSFEGEQKARRESLSSLWKGFAVALLAIFTLLAIPFRSYIQPLIVMSAIPFGVVGAVWGHVLMGLPLTILSLFGIVALAGVVVNDALVLIDYINRAREAGAPVRQAVLEAGVRRFRPILLTTLTTFFGLLPMILEKSMQAQFLIPMAISLGFGVVAATTITLVLVPSLYVIVEDVKRLFGFKGREARWHETGARDGRPPAPEAG
jgi:multidrug efflux pump subunit AcrB